LALVVGGGGSTASATDGLSDLPDIKFVYVTDAAFASDRYADQMFQMQKEFVEGIANDIEAQMVSVQNSIYSQMEILAHLYNTSVSFYTNDCPLPYGATYQVPFGTYDGSNLIAVQGRGQNLELGSSRRTVKLGTFGRGSVSGGWRFEPQTVLTEM
jgi:hypothetical protein